MDDRVCECGCGESMEGRREGARFLNAGHRKRTWSREHPGTAPRPLASVENGSGGRSGVDARSGAGIRVYFSREQAAHVAMLLAFDHEEDGVAVNASDRIVSVLRRVDAGLRVLR